MSIRTHALPALLVVLLVVPVVVPAAGAGYLPVDVSRDEVSARTITMLVPAVGELPDGALRGVTMRMEATLRDGSGGVFIDTRPLTQIDMQGSARIAAATAASIAGAQADEYDYVVTMRSPATTVGGPSAGAVMTVAFLALLLDIPVRDDVVMTGMINPDGTVGAVGGILEKAEAAHRAGATLFLVPEGQSVVRRVVREVQEGGWFPTVTTREEVVNVTRHARQAWGLEVREVSDVHDAFRAMTDHAIERPAPPDAVASPIFDEVMGQASADHLATATARYDALEARRAASGLTGSADEQVTAVLERGRERLDRAASAWEAGGYYTASSLVFQARLDLQAAHLLLGAFAAEDQRAYLRQAGRDAADRLERAHENASAARPRTVSTLEAVGAAQVRVLNAANLLDQAERALAEDRLAAAVDALAFSIERSGSVDWWLELATTLERSATGDARLQADPSALAVDLLAVAQQSVAYAEALLAQTGGDATLTRLLGESRSGLESAQAALRERLPVGGLYLAMEAQVAAHAALSLVGSTALIEDRIDRQRDRALIQVARLRELGAEPFLAVSFLDFAASLRADRPVDALLMYGNAATIAATSGALATGELCGFASLSCAGTPPAVHRVGVPMPDPWTAYFALATMILGFMAGVLIALVVLQARDRRLQTVATPHRVSMPRPAVTVPAAPGIPAETTNGAPPRRVRAAAPVLPPAQPYAGTGRRRGPLPSRVHRRRRPAWYTRTTINPK